MLTVGLCELRRKFSELLRRAGAGERIGITRRGKIVALIIAPESRMTVSRAFADIEEIQERIAPHKGITIKELIEEGRR